MNNTFGYSKITPIKTFHKFLALEAGYARGVADALRTLFKKVSDNKAQKFRDLRALPSACDSLALVLFNRKPHPLRRKFAQIGAACQKAWFLAAT